jgi:DNA-binding transcriptional LysR family regulator
MQIEALKVICDVARLRSFSRAAAANRMTQSAVSQMVLQLERRLGTQLVDRSTRPLRMTAPGLAYASGCEEIIRRYQEIEDAVAGGHADLPQSVQVVAIYSVGYRDMNQYVERFARHQPHADIHFEYLHPDKVYARVLNGSADLGLVSFPKGTRDLQSLPWREERMVLACPPQHRLAGRGGVRPSLLHGEPFIGFDRGLVVRRQVDRFLREQGVEVDVLLEFDNIENIKRAILDGAGVALLPLPSLQPEVRAGTLAAIPLRGAQLVRLMGIIHRKHSLGSAAARFIQVLQEPETNGESTPAPAELKTASA